MTRALTVLLMVAFLGACDEARVREGSSQFADHEQAAMRVFVTPEGIGNIYDVASPDGFVVTGDVESIVSEDGASVELGPIEQPLAVRSRMVEPAVGALEVGLQFRNPQVFVPVKIRQGFDVRICRYRISGSLVTATGLVSLVETAEGSQLDVTSEPQVQIDGANVDSVEACAGALDELISPEELATAMVDYVRAAVASSAAAAMRTSPLDVLGLVRRNLQISRISAFDNRRGVLAVEGITPQRAEALALNPEGLVATVDATADAQRARCAPPVGLDPHQDMGTMDVDPSVVRRFGADFALAVSTSWIQRMAQAATLAGFSCHGLEDARETEDNLSLIDTNELLLEEIDLANVPLGEHVRLVLRPGSLPRIANKAGNGTIEVVWDDLQVDVYGQVFGAWSRIASVISDVRLNLRPQSLVGVAAFDLETLEVSEPRIESEFLAVPPQQEQVRRWTQRTLFLLLEERLELPLPLEAGGLLRVVNTQVRDHDIVYYLRFEE